MIRIQRFFLTCLIASLMLSAIISCSKPKCPEPIVPTPVQTTTITIVPGPTDQSAFISSFAPTTPRPNEPSIEAFAWTISGNPVILRSLLDINLSSLPSGATIQKATLILFSDTTGQQNLTIHKGHSTLSGSNSWVLQKVTSPWSESTVTWNTAPSTEISDQIVLPTSISDDQTYSIDVTAFIEDELSSPSSFHGFMFKLVNETSYRAIQFCSPNTNFPELRPQLVIEYQL